MQDFKKYKGIAGRLAAFFAILILMLAGLSQLFHTVAVTDERTVPEEGKPMLALAKEPPQTIDMVVLGNSLSYTCVLPMQLWEDHGITTFLCGQPGQLAQQAYYSLETVFETQKPDIVLIETEMMFEGNDGADSWRDSVDFWAAKQFPFVHFHDMWKSLLMGKTYEGTYFKGAELRFAISPYWDGEYMFPTDEIEPFTNYSAQHMTAIKELCEKNGAQLILFSCPAPRHYSYAEHNALEAWSTENEVPYLDLNLSAPEIGIDWGTDALDGGDHINYYGARKLTRYFGRYLTEHYELEDHRGDPAYQEWDEENARYHAFIGF